MTYEFFVDSLGVRCKIPGTQWAICSDYKSPNHFNMNIKEEVLAYLEYWKDDDDDDPFFVVQGIFLSNLLSDWDNYYQQYSEFKLKILL